MVSVAASIRRQLREAGVAAKAINQFWPEWWTADAESSISATTELRYTLARRLGVSPSSLFGGPPRFVGSDNAKFKNWECTDKLMQTTKQGKALYMHCLPADITGVSCKEGEVASGVFERYRLTTYREASHKPFIIAAMILLTRFEKAGQVLKQLIDLRVPRRGA